MPNSQEQHRTIGIKRKNYTKPAIWITLSMRIYDTLHKNMLLYSNIIVLPEDGLCRPKHVGEFFYLV
jgi:hypothetical protein